MYNPQNVNPQLRAYHTLETQGHDMSGLELPQIQSVHDVSYLVRRGFTDWRRYGEVYTDTMDNLTLFCYRPQAQYDNRWNTFERISRGLIINSAGEVVARPFDKFFQWGTPHYTLSPLKSVTEKLDGSLGISYWHDGQLRIATKGSFMSEQAIWGTAWLNGRAPLMLSNGEPVPPFITLMFEIIYPTNRVVVNYGDYEGLVLIGARNIATEQLYSHRWLDAFAKLNDLARPKRYDMANEYDLQKAVSVLGANEEGFVAEFADGQMFKFKGREYIQLHKLVTNLTFKDVVKVLRDGEADSLKSKIDQTFVTFWEKFNGYAVEIMKVVKRVEAKCHATYGQSPPHANQKEYAAWVQENHPDIQHYLFAMRKGKDIWTMIFDKEF